MPSESGAVHLLVIAVAAVIAVLALAALLERDARRHGPEAHFWFEDVTCDLAGREAVLGGALTERECARIREIASSELRHAYKGLRLRIADGPGGTYRIRVLQEFPARRGPANPVGMARPMGPLGGEAAVNFRAVAALALHHAPAGASRSAVIDGMGRGIGRTAAHELAHLVLFGTHVPASTDAGSYEYESPDRPEQYYGSLRWDTAWPMLVRKLGRATVHPDGAWILDVQWGDTRRLLGDAAAEECASSPDGPRVAYHTRRRGAWSLWQLDLDGALSG